MDRLQEIVRAATTDDRELMRDGLHLGLVVDEHRLDFERGDFLVRNLLGVDQSTGLARGRAKRSRSARPCSSRCATRDAADEDLALPARPACRAQVCCCSRATAGARTCSPSPVTTRRWSRSCSDRCPSPVRSAPGEIGPVGGRNFLHGFTASVAVFG